MTTFYAACHNEEEHMIMHASNIPMGKFQVSGAFGSCNGLICLAEGYKNSDSIATGLGFDSLTNTFKMARTYKRPSSSYSTLSVFVHGFLHWRIKALEMKNCQGQILAFGVSKETFKVIPSPEIVVHQYSDRLFRMLDIKGNLGMLDL
ncbi:hypothetical protein AgCh_004662 [Apium graveolens]